MTPSANLVAQWECFDTAAFAAERHVEQALDAYCAGTAAAPAPAQIASARRLRFIARHRLRWIVYQTRTAQTKLKLI